MGLYSEHYKFLNVKINHMQWGSYKIKNIEYHVDAL